MANFPRFLIAQNLKAESDATYVLHTQKPRFLAKRLYYDAPGEFRIVDDIDNMNEFFKNDQSKVEGLMNRMRDWYRAYNKQASDDSRRNQ